MQSRKETTPMLQAMRRRLERDEEGFTLIELMVVVLIIAILLAIAIPTFLGARQRAQNRAAQSNLRNALTAEKTWYTDQQAYSQTKSELVGIEPSLSFDTAADTAPTVGNVSYYVDANGAVYLAAKSASGTCFYLKDVPVQVTGGPSPGTYYAGDTTCASLSTTAVTGTKWP
jgi:type IV pilus assembly protein PilA